RIGCFWADVRRGAGFCPQGVARSVHITRFCPEGVGADLSAKGCEAALKPVTSVVSDVPYI
ncbi:hypothetical protein EGV01_30245, partial [Pseudomonas syringae pv. theae]|nr:hypothetical protein [Pseudomonas syringae pv. theae]